LAFDRGGMNPFRDLGTLGRLLRLYRRTRPAIVHHVAMKPVIYGSLAARASGVPAIVNALSGLGYVFSSSETGARRLRVLVTQLMRLALRGRHQRLIVQNVQDREAVLGLALTTPDSVRMIRGAGVDPAAFRQVMQDVACPTVLLPARFLRDKGLREFAAAARVLKQRGVRARFVLVGRPDPENPASIDAADVQRWVEEGILENLGWRDDMPEILSQSQIVCLPSYHEGLPKALLEAAASGCAIVATDIAGCRELIANGRTGWLVPPRDVNALATALQAAIENTELRKRYASEARAAVVAEFSVQRVIADTLAIYAEVGAPTRMDADGDAC
jgi:glycosyltransferase involved in cell wall biosynthesis